MKKRDCDCLRKDLLFHLLFGLCTDFHFQSLIEFMYVSREPFRSAFSEHGHTVQNLQSDISCISFWYIFPVRFHPRLRTLFFFFFLFGFNCSFDFLAFPSDGTHTSSTKVMMTQRTAC